MERIKIEELKVVPLGAKNENPLSEDALALRFSERHANDLRYIAAKG